MFLSPNDVIRCCIQCVRLWQCLNRFAIRMKDASIYASALSESVFSRTRSTHCSGRKIGRETTSFGTDVLSPNDVISSIHSLYEIVCIVGPSGVEPERTV